MMDIYIVLSKHFSGNITEKEQLLINDFIESNPKEYQFLKLLWQREGVLEVRNFDSRSAWKSILKKVPKPTQKRSKTIKIKQKLPLIAAVAAILLITILTIPTLFNTSTLNQKKLVALNETDSIIKLELPDGSFVWLNQNAEVNYPENFCEQQRAISLKGEAFFEVIRDEEKPFIVNTSQSQTQVLGTSFNIKTNSDETKVTVATGKVMVSLKHDKSQFKVLTAGQKAIANNQNISISRNKNENYLSWKTGVLIFNQTTVFETVQILNQHFGHQVLIDDQFSSDCLFTSTFKQSKLEDILNVVRLSCQFNLFNNGSSYIIK